MSWCAWSPRTPPSAARPDAAHPWGLGQTAVAWCSPTRAGAASTCSSSRRRRRSRSRHAPARGRPTAPCVSRLPGRHRAALACRAPAVPDPVVGRCARRPCRCTSRPPGSGTAVWCSPGRAAWASRRCSASLARDDGAPVSDNLCTYDGERLHGLPEPRRVDAGTAEGPRRTMPHGRVEQPWDGREHAIRPSLLLVLRRGTAERPTVRPVPPAVAARALVAGTYAAGELRRYWAFAATLALGTGLGPAHPAIVGEAERLAAVPPVPRGRAARTSGDLPRRDRRPRRPDAWLTAPDAPRSRRRPRPGDDADDGVQGRASVWPTSSPAASAGAGGVAVRGAVSLPRISTASTLVVGSGDVLLDVARAHGVDVVVVPELVSPISPTWTPRALRSTRRLLRSESFDVVHTHSAKAGVLGRVAASRAGCPRIVHTLHGFPWHDFQPAAVRQAYIRTERALAAHHRRLPRRRHRRRRRGPAAAGRPPGPARHDRAGRRAGPVTVVAGLTGPGAGAARAARRTRRSSAPSGGWTSRRRPRSCSRRWRRMTTPARARLGRWRSAPARRRPVVRGRGPRAPGAAAGQPRRTCPSCCRPSTCSRCRAATRACRAPSSRPRSAAYPWWRRR